jgi:hypothetical protein
MKKNNSISPVVNVFHWRGQSSCFAPLQRVANQRAESARRVEEGRAMGKHTGTIYGLTKKSDRRRETQ